MAMPENLIQALHVAVTGGDRWIPTSSPSGVRVKAIFEQSIAVLTQMHAMHDLIVEACDRESQGDASALGDISDYREALAELAEELL